jgi:hypothetical protein
MEGRELPRLTRMARQFPDSGSSPERLFSSVGLVKRDLWGNLLDTTLMRIDVMWAKQAP